MLPLAMKAQQSLVFSHARMPALSLGQRKGVLQRACVERIDKTLYGLRQVAAEHLD